MPVKARVKMDLRAQLDEEIDLCKGEIVTINEVIDKDWYRGEKQGKTGIIPSSFVVLLEDEAPQQDDVDCAQPYETQLGKASHLQRQQSSPLPVQPFPNNSVMSDYSATDVLCLSDSKPLLTVRTLYPFTAHYDDEIGFDEGEIITSVSHLNDQWMKGSVKGREGIFPKSYVEIVTDCNTQADNLHVESTKSHSIDNSTLEIISGITQARVLFDYIAQTPGDLTLVEDEIITIIKKLNSDWYEAKDCQGNLGLCPANYIDIFSSAQRRESLASASVLKNSHSEEFVSNNSSSIDHSFTNTSNRTIQRQSFTMDSSSTNLPKLIPVVEDKAYNSQAIFSPVIDYSAKRNFNRDDFSKSSATTSSELDKSIMKNLATLDTSVSSNRMKVVNRSQSFSIWSTTQASETVSNKIDTRNKYTSESDRRRTMSFTSTPPPRPSPPCFIKQRELESKETKFAMTCMEGKNTLKLSKPPPIPPPPRVSLDLLDEVSADIVATKRPHRSAPLPPAVAANTIEPKKIVQPCNNNTSIPHRPAPPVPMLYSKRPMSRGLSQDVPVDSITWQEKVNQPVHVRMEPERHNSSSSSSPITVNEEKDKELQIECSVDQQKFIIQELLQTEQLYIRDLKLCIQTFLTNVEEGKSKGVDIETMFGNLKDIVSLAEKLYLNLSTAAACGSKKEISAISQCFQDVADDMKILYGFYCANHEDVILLMEKYRDDPEIQTFISAKMNIIHKHISCLNLNALLIKPVQRILKYPLLLDALLKHTEYENPGRNDLENAILIMRDLATSVNESKRKKDLVTKYLRDEDTSFSAVLSKINIHSMVKKSTRMGMRLSSSIGLTSVTKDELFDDEENKFHMLEKAIRNFAKDVTTFCMQLEDWAKIQFQVSEDIAQYYMEECKNVDVDRYRTVQRELYSTVLLDFKNSVGKRVALPLDGLLQTFSGPSKLIQKRFDKLLDYDNCSGRLERNKDFTKTTQLQEEYNLTKNNYEALNSQLKEELPKLFTLALGIFQDCVKSFFISRKRFIGRVVKEILPLMDVPSIQSLKGDVLDDFYARQTNVLAHFDLLSFIPKNLFASKVEVTKTASEKKDKPVQPAPAIASTTGTCQEGQTSDQRNKVESTYNISQLYVVTQSYEASNNFEITVTPGNLIGVIKQQDPMGSKSRWFVDNGVMQGFIPSSFLQKHKPIQIQIQDHSSTNKCIPLAVVLPSSTQTKNPMEEGDRYDIPFDSDDRYDIPPEPDDRYDIPPDEMDECKLSLQRSTEASPTNMNHANISSEAESEYYFASYDFNASTSSELSLHNGQVVLVVHKQDMAGHTEWWYVQDRYGNEGFVPANYLKKIQNS